MLALPAEMRPLLDPLGKLFHRTAGMLWIVLPEPHAQLHAHNTGHWSKKRLLIQALRWKARQLCLNAGAVPWPAATIEYRFFFADNRRHDETNAVQSQKAAIDGIVDAKVIPDDNYKHLHVYGIFCGVDATNPRTELILRKSTTKELEAFTAKPLTF